MKTTVRGREIEYDVTDDGIFKATLEGETYRSKTLASLKSALDGRLKKKPLNIPIIKTGARYSDGKLTLRRGVLVGVHSSNGNALVRWDGSKGVEQLSGSSYSADLLFATVDVAKLTELHDNQQTATEAFDGYVRKHPVNLPSLAKTKEAD